MRALCWEGVNRNSFGKVLVRNVPEPTIHAPHDAILKVRVSSACGSDLHVINGHLPGTLIGDILGHEFIGEVVEIGSEVRRIQRGDRVVCSSVIGCGGCFYCKNNMWSLCDSSNPHPEMLDAVCGQSSAAIYGWSHIFGGFPGSHAEYVRVPFADFGCFPVPDTLHDEQALFLSDTLPTGFMAAELCGIRPGNVVAVWGCGGVGQMAIKSAFLLGAERVIAIDRHESRLVMASELGHAEVVNRDSGPVGEILAELTAGRGPDCYIDAVGMESIVSRQDKQKDPRQIPIVRGEALIEALQSCRKGGTVVISGTYFGSIENFPIGTVMTKGLTIRSGYHHGQKYAAHLLYRIARGDIDPTFLITHHIALEDGLYAYQLFQQRGDGCVRFVFTPHGAAATRTMH